VAEGEDAQATELADALRKRGHRVDAHALTRATADRAASAADELAASWIGVRPDVVHARSWTSGLAVHAARMSLSASPPLTVVQGTVGGAPLAAVQAPGEFTATLARRAVRVIATSGRQIEDLVASGVRREHIDLVPVGVDIESFTPRGNLLPRGSAPRLITVGPWGRGSGHDTTIAALRHVPGAELLVAGGPPAASLEKDPEASRLTDLARRWGVTARVRLLGQVAQSGFPALLRSADVVVSVPSHDVDGAVVVYAMACGRAVVATAVGGQADALVEGATGVFVPGEDPRVLGRVLRALLGDPVRLDGFGLAATERAQLRYAWSRVAEETERSYRRAMGVS
jgi:glycosyltransferase involved in cell wall biosynthesis